VKRLLLQDPVPYTVIYYQPQGPETMKRLQGEFNKVIELLDKSQEQPQKATITYI
jgi:hypothetical protein